ncbi:MAG: hypothetical protein IKR00_04770 [Lachnospiraceae bacterium]|nr:hypothetical protein [Lachnospiraceae bacterium]
MKVCPNCGSGCEENIKFCANCGTALDTAAAETAKADPQDIYDELELDDEELYEEDYGVKKPVSVIAVIALICSIAGCISSAYGMIIVFGNLVAGLAFLLPGVLGILLGFLASSSTGRGKPKKGRAISVIAIILGIAGIAFWLVVVLILRHMAAGDFGTGDMIGILRTIMTLR